MSEERPYATPVALRAAITDRLRRVAAEDANQSFPDLLRQFAYDRLLYRIFTSEDRDRWVLKGATALLARLRGHARHSIDIDLYDQAGGLDEAEAGLKAAAQRDVGDHFRFVLAPGRRIAEGGVALRVNVTAFLGATQFATFHVDLVAGAGMTGPPEEAESFVPIEVPGVPRTRYRIYPLADHVADKVFAIVEEHARRNGPPIASTRYRDLADLVVIARYAEVEADALVRALQAQAHRRRLLFPTEFRPPDDAGWRAGYARLAREIPGLEERDFDSAVESAKRFIDPILQDAARGRWSPRHQVWTG